MIKSEAVDRAMPYQIKHLLQKLRHSAKIEYDNFVRSIQTDDNSPSLVVCIYLYNISNFSFHPIYFLIHFGHFEK